MSPISFAEVPATIRTPGTYVEFDSSRAVQGPVKKPFKALIVGQMDDPLNVDALEDTVYQITSGEQAAILFGAGFPLHKMCERFLDNSTVTAVYAIGQHLAAGTAAAHTITVTASSVAAGTAQIYIAGERVSVPITANESSNDIATAIAAAITAAYGLPVTAIAATNVVTCTAVFVGVNGTDIDIRDSYYGDETLPSGLSFDYANSVPGSGSDDIDDVWAALDDTQYDVIVSFDTDDGNYTKIDAELALRWDATHQNDGVCFVGRTGTNATLVTWGDGKNSKHVSAMGIYLSPSPPWEWSSAVAGLVSKSAQNDPAMPFQTLYIRGVLPPALDVMFTQAERQLLLLDGVSTFKLDSGGTPNVGRLITNNQETAAGAPTTAFLDVNTPMTLSYLRWDFRRRIMTTYPRTKLSGDDIVVGSGQKIITPNIGKAFALAAFKEWMREGLTEDYAQFEQDLVVERNPGDPTRLDFLLPINIVNQLRIVGAVIQFRL
jgi:phage tail sheath gpL-like